MSLGTNVLTAADITALADLPSREELLAQFAGALQAPLVKTAGLLQALPRNLAYGLSALIDLQVGRHGRRRLNTPHTTHLSERRTTSWLPRKRSSTPSAHSPCSS